METVRHEWSGSGAQLAQLGIGARAALDSIAEQDRDRAEVPIPAAAIHLAEGSPERTIELLAPFTIIPVEGLVERYLRHRTAHATFLSTILDLRGTRSGHTAPHLRQARRPQPRRSPAPESSGSSHHPDGASAVRRK